MPVMPTQPGNRGAAPQNFYQPSTRPPAAAPMPPTPPAAPVAPVAAPSAPVRTPPPAPVREPSAAAPTPSGHESRFADPRVLPVHAVPLRVAGDKDTGDVFDKTARFADLGLSDAVMRGVTDAGFEFPTSIQAQIIPLLLTGRDMLGQAKTGTGKTAAFGLPMLSRLSPGDSMAGIVLVPTRELAIQVATDLNELGRHTGMTALPVYGGQNISTQAQRLARGPEIIVATPGRLMDMRERGYLNYDNVKIAVLDEVDRMLDIGFRDDIKRILGSCPKDRQTVFVSATLPKEVETLARTFARDAEKIVATSGSLTATMVKQYHLPVEPWDKKQLLLHLLTHESPALTLVFCRTKKTVDNLAEYLNRKGIDAHAMHGDMQQSKRNKALAELKSGNLSVLIASDLASRGLDVEGITHVINYDLPEDPDLYVHRIGRTARAGRDGVAWALVTPEQGPLLTDIEMLINAEIPKLDYPDFKPGPVPDDVRVDRQAAERRASGVKTFNRFASGPISAPPQAIGAAPAPIAVDPSKFPGGIVPSKLPERRLGGKVRTARSMRGVMAQPPAPGQPPAPDAPGAPAPGAGDTSGN
jgi:ATP-dependent RNA helicase DeaD